MLYHAGASHCSTAQVIQQFALRLCKYPDSVRMQDETITQLSVQVPGGLPKARNKTSVLVFTSTICFLVHHRSNRKRGFELRHKQSPQSWTFAVLNCLHFLHQLLCRAWLRWRLGCWRSTAPGDRCARSTLSVSSGSLRKSNQSSAPTVSDHRGHSPSLTLDGPGLAMSFVATLASTSDLWKSAYRGPCVLSPRAHPECPG